MELRGLSGVLYSTILSDVLGSARGIGRTTRTFVRPADDSLVPMERARTGLYALTQDRAEGGNPWEPVDSLRRREVAVIRVAVDKVTREELAAGRTLREVLAK